MIVLNISVRWEAHYPIWTSGFKTGSELAMPMAGICCFNEKKKEQMWEAYKNKT